MANEQSVVTGRGTLTRFLSKEKHIRASVVEMTDLVNQACIFQKTSPSSSVALGRTLVGTTLVASQLKEKYTITFQFNCTGILRGVYAQASSDGKIRGYISNKEAPMSIDQKKFTLAPLVQGGTLMVATLAPGSAQPQKSQTEIVSGEIGQDIAHYLNQSMQIPCIISLGVKIGSGGKIIAAGGVLIEMMPGHSEDTLDYLESIQAQAQSLSTLVEQKASFTDMLKNHVGDVDMKELETGKIEYSCPCTRERALRSVEMLGPKEVQEIVDEGEEINVDCEMCGRNYSVSIEEANMILKKIGDNKVH